MSHTTDDMIFQWDPIIPLVVNENIELPQLQLVKNQTADCTQVYSTGKLNNYYIHVYYWLYSLQCNCVCIIKLCQKTIRRNCFPRLCSRFYTFFFLNNSCATYYTIRKLIVKLLRWLFTEGYDYLFFDYIYKSYYKLVIY